ncbi:hypothetical protein Bca52824_029133 [Brassica carinata]|uniref:Uncharacterized protein n=1 Tax=Brassica carinata TaxID=52824 RepID=A0A8X8APA1_BRACI|nr:hypothetical protein Bca52824_029133 [Brassica carinata]
MGRKGGMNTKDKHGEDQGEEMEEPNPGPIPNLRLSDWMCKSLALFFPYTCVFGFLSSSFCLVSQK